MGGCCDEAAEYGINFGADFCKDLQSVSCSTVMFKCSVIYWQSELIVFIWIAPITKCRGIKWKAYLVSNKRAWKTDLWPTGWSLDCLQEWGPFVKLAIPSMLMLCLEWWLFEVGGFLAGIISEVELGAQSIVYELAVVAYMVTFLFIASSRELQWMEKCWPCISVQCYTIRMCSHLVSLHSSHLDSLLLPVYELGTLLAQEK